MPETTQPSSGTAKKSTDENESTTLHTCACGEQHEDLPGSPSHRDACESPKKFGDSCCCASGEAGKEARHPCGQGPRCH